MAFLRSAPMRRLRSLLRSPFVIITVLAIAFVAPWLYSALRDLKPLTLERTNPSSEPAKQAPSMPARVPGIDLEARLRQDAAPIGSPWSEVLRSNVRPPYKRQDHPNLPRDAYSAYAQVIARYLPDNVDRVFWTVVGQETRSNPVQFAAVPGRKGEPDRLIVDLADAIYTRGSRVMVRLKANGKAHLELPEAGPAQNDVFIFRLPAEAEYNDAIRGEPPVNYVNKQGETIPAKPQVTTLTVLVQTDPKDLHSIVDIAKVVMGPPAGQRQVPLGTPEADWLQLAKFLAVVRRATGNAS